MYFWPTALNQFRFLPLCSVKLGHLCSKTLLKFLLLDLDDIHAFHNAISHI